MSTETDPVAETHPFQAEVAELLRLMVHAVYSETDVFLRELISNASDACDKLRYEAIAKPELLAAGGALTIRITPDAAAGTLTVADTGIGVEPSFAIGQRALLIVELDGCVMWDCVPLATSDAVEHIKSLGGLKAIAVSHPHFYGAVADWSEAFGGAPVYLHGDDRKWITRPHPAIVPWSGESHRLSDDILLVRTGGHFAGATILHWRGGAGGRGALLTGDVAMVAADRHSLSFMYSFPNYIPLNAKSVRGIARAIEPLAFDRVYGAWWGRNIEAGARAAFDASVRRYLAAISDEAGS